MANVLSRISLADPAVFVLANSAKMRDMVDLTEKYEHYRRRFRDAMQARGLTNEEMGGRLDAHPVTVSKLRNGSIDLDDEWRARISSALGLDEDEFFGDDPLPAPAASEIFRPLKKRGRKPANDNRVLQVYGFAAGAAQGHRTDGYQVLEEIPRPPGLFGIDDAYALRTRNESMIPRYMPEDILYVNPEQKPKPGDHVIIQIQLFDDTTTETWVKRYDASTTDEIIVYQYNPPAQMRFRREHVRYMHRVLPTNELFPAL